MKTVKTSFLFFYTYIIGLFFLNSNLIFSQQPIDSIGHYYNLAINPQNETDLASAYNFFINHKETSLKKKDVLGAIHDLRLMAIILNKSGFSSDSESFAIEALKLLDHLEINMATTEARIGIYNHLGKVHRALLEYEIALEYYNKTLEIAQTPQQINIVLNNRAFVYKEQNQLELAIKEFTKAYNISLEINDKKEIARVLDNLGLVQSKLGYSEALTNMMNALDIRLKEKDVSGIYASYKHLTEYYKDRNNKERALYFANKALTVAKSIKSKSFKFDALSLLMELDDNPYVIEFKKLNDSINLANRLSENKYSSKKYDYTEKEKSLKESEVKREKEKYLFIAIWLLLVFLFVFIYFILKSKHKRDKIQQVYNTEARISKKVHDEVANDVYHVMTKLQADKISNEAILDDLEKVYIKTRDISKENSTIDFKEDFKELLNDLLLGYKSDDVSIVTRDLNTINWDAIPDLTKTAIYRVLQELMTNMRKHSKATIAVLTFKKQANKIVIDYKDNGIGCILKKHSGLQNAENRITSIKGTITFESEINKGFKAKIIV